MYKILGGKIMEYIKEYPNKTIIYVTHKKQDNLFNRVINLESNYEK